MEILLLPAFFRENLQARYRAHLCLALEQFHKNRKDPRREIQWFANLGHNMCENDKQNLDDYIE